MWPRRQRAPANPKRGAKRGAMALPPEAAEQVRVLKSLERAILVQADRAAGGSGPLGTLDARDPAWTSDAASRARGGLSLARLDRELRELEALAEEQVRPVDRSAVLAALAERVAARDAVRQMLRELAVRGGTSSPQSDARAARAELLGTTPTTGNRDRSVAKEDDDQQADSRRAPASEANALALAARSTDSLRRSRALMGEELEKGRRTLAAMEESRATMRKTGDEYAGDQRAALAGGGRLLSRLEKQAVWERRTLWCGFVCFMLAAAHVVLKRTPVLVRFHPLWWIRHAAVRKAKQAAKAAAAEAKAAKTLQAPTPTPLAAAAAAAAAMATAAVDAALAAEGGGVADAVYAEAYLDEAASAGLPDDPPGARADAEVGEYSRAEPRLADEL